MSRHVCPHSGTSFVCITNSLCFKQNHNIHVLFIAYVFMIYLLSLMIIYCLLGMAPPMRLKATFDDASRRVETRRNMQRLIGCFGFVLRLVCHGPQH